MERLFRRPTLAIRPRKAPVKPKQSPGEGPFEPGSNTLVQPTEASFSQLDLTWSQVIIPKGRYRG
jgi:hypothetical protein